MEGTNGIMGIVGASGFLGGALAELAHRRGWRVVGFSRKRREPGGPVDEWREWSDRPDLSRLTVLVNLAGESIAQRWTEGNREKFHASRVGVTNAVVKAMVEADHGPGMLINGSAVGIYGDRGDEELTEAAHPGEGYLADLCVEWEKAAQPLVERGVDVAWLRTGVVLGRGGDAWEQMRKVFSLGLGGKFGSGQQWMPWIHVEDLVGAMLHMAQNRVTGPVNGVAPEPERNGDFTKKLASALSRPAFFHAPGWGLKLGLGDFAGALLASQRALPDALLKSGFRFRYPSLDSALVELC